MTDRRDRGVTPRVVVLCMALLLFFGYCVPIIDPIIDYKLMNTHLGATHLPPSAIVALLLLLLVNPLLQVLGRAMGGATRGADRWAFRRNEMLTVYSACWFSCLVPRIGGESYIVPNLINSFYYATRENGWRGFCSPISSRGCRPRSTSMAATIGGWWRSDSQGWGTTARFPGACGW